MNRLNVVVLIMMLSQLIPAVRAKPLPLPPEPNPVGEKQPAFGAANGYFTFDEKPAVIISGSIHYPRVPRPYWVDRIRKAKAMGFNCIGTYLFWNAHEKQPGQLDFSGNLDVAAFVRTCQQEGMWVIVRPGPYICSEWDFGGMPAWLLKDPDMQVRTHDPKFLKATARYLKAVGEQLRELQVTQGGPIIQVQVENEYGQFGRPGNADDMAYNRAIYDQLVTAGFDTMFIRCDWPVKRTIGTAHLNEVMTTMNFGGSAENAFAFFEKEYPGLPKMCGEYWVGWFDHWGAKHHTKALAPFIKQIDWMLANEVSFNVYMLHGGTNWGFTSGANWSGQYSADTTSYDYDAPLDETGRITPKFYTFRNAISKYLPADHQLPDPPEQIKRIEVPQFTLSETAAFAQLQGQPFVCEKPTYLEALDQTQGLALYRTEVTIPKAGDYPIVFSALKDRAIVMIDGKRLVTLDRRKKENRAKISLPAGKVQLDILLENLGHLNYARELMRDRKGLGTVTLAGKEVLNWKIYSFPLTLDDIDSLKFTSPPIKDSSLPIFYRGSFSVNTVGDTLLDMTGWGKGMIWVNGINLGRFWDIGPQYTLFLPGCWMKQGENEVIVMDIEPTDHQSIRGVTEPIYGLKVDKNLKYNRKPGEAIKLLPEQMVAEGEFENGDHAQTVEFNKPTKARYVCVESLNSHSNDNHASIAEIYLLDTNGKRLDRNPWQVIYADSEELIAEPTSADNIIDEQPVTIWHTQYQNGNTPHPHQVVIDLGAVKTINSLVYLPRNGAKPGKIKSYRIYTSEKLFKGLKDPSGANVSQSTPKQEKELTITSYVKKTDTDGKHINAHGGGMLYHEGTYYLFGEHKIAGRAGNKAHVGISCYSSEDLHTWKNEGIALKVINKTGHDIEPGCVMERPKVIYNQNTEKFVMWFHLELKGQGYDAARTALAVADKPMGPYTYKHSLRPNAGQWPMHFPRAYRTPLSAAQIRQIKASGMHWKDYKEPGVLLRRDFKGGQMSRDMTLFVDDDGTAYHIHSAEENYTLHISQLSEDYQSFTGRYVRVAPYGHNEAPAICKYQDNYYMIASGCTGWAPNEARSFTAKNILGPWKYTGNPCSGINPYNNLGPEKTFGAQSTYILPIQNQDGCFMAMFDVWKPQNQIDSRYIWLPAFIKNGRIKVEWVDPWNLHFK